MGSRGIVFLLICFHAPPEGIFFSFAFFGLLLLLLKDGRGFGCSGGGLGRLMPLVGDRASYGRESREGCEQDFGVNGLKHHGIQSREVRVPGAPFLGGTRVVSRTLLLHEDSGVEIFDSGIPALHVSHGHLRGKASLESPL